jgi:hypothetical protein
MRILFCVACIFAFSGHAFTKGWIDSLPGSLSFQTSLLADNVEYITSYASLPAAISAIGPVNKKTLVIPTAQTVSDNLTVTSNIILHFTGSGRVDVNPGVTLTINSPSQSWPLRQILGGSGAVRFGTVTSVAYPEWFGAIGDGSADDTTAIDKTQLALSPGASLYLSPRTYLVNSGLTLKKSNLRWIGAGMFASVIKRTNGHLFTDSDSFPVENIVFEKLGFDANNSSFFIMTFGGHVRGIRVSGCRFWKFGASGGAGYGFLASAMPNITIEDCLFHNPGNSAGQAIQVQDGSSNVTVRRNRFLYCGGGFSAQGSANQPVEDVRFEDNYSDQGWMYLLAESSGSGEGVTYTSNTLKDANATFRNILQYTTVRIMPVRARGEAGATYTRTKLTDSNAPFASVERGDFVRTATAFAIVTAKESDGIIRVEEWLSDADRLPVAAPEANTSYTVYRLLLGDVVSNTGTQITVNRWFDIHGKSVTPAARTRYELLVRQSNHAVNIGPGVRNVKIESNTITRSGADQIIAWGSRQSIQKNFISFGWDMGITVRQDHNLVSGNIIEHQGVGGIWTDGSDNLISGNEVFDSRWINNATNAFVGDIMVQNGKRNRIQGNLCDRVTTVNGFYGICIVGDGNCADNVVQDNTVQNHLTDDIVIVASSSGAITSATHVQGNRAGVISQYSGIGLTITGSRFWNNKATVFNLTQGFWPGTYSNTQLRDNDFGSIRIGGGTSPSGTDYGVQRGSGSPEGVVYGSVGNIYMRSDGGAGTSLYVKERGDDTNTGWVAK